MKLIGYVTLQIMFMSISIGQNHKKAPQVRIVSPSLSLWTSPVNKINLTAILKNIDKSSQLTFKINNVLNDKYNFNGNAFVATGIPLSSGKNLFLIIAKNEYGEAIDSTIVIYNEPNYYESGSDKLLKSDFIGAIQDFNMAIELNPKSVESYIKRGSAKSNTGDFIGAIQDFNMAIELNPVRASGYYGRGVNKGMLNDYRGAIKDLNIAININPSESLLYQNRALYKAKLNNHNEAIQDFNKAIELNPKNSRAYYFRGISKYNVENIEEACLDLSKAGELGIIEAYNKIQEYCNK